MEQEAELLEKEGNTKETKNKIPNWVLAGFKTEEEYNELIQKIKDDLKTRELHPWVKEVSGMVSTGKEERPENIFNDYVKKNLHKTKKRFMKQETEILEKKGNTKEAKNKIPNWVLAGFNTEEEYIELLKKIDNYLLTAELHPWVKEFGGMINTGKEESTDTIFD